MPGTSYLCAVVATVVTADGGMKGAFVTAAGATVSAAGGLASMDEDEVMRATHAYQQQMAAKAAGPCVDADANCAMWARQGECEANAAYMKAQCAVSCNSCGWAPPGCATRANQTAAAREGDIEAMFARAEQMTHLGPKVWSRDPWVLTFDNFLSDAEAESFIETIGEDNFGRSLAGDVVSPVRTSHQSWCQSEPCLSDERTRAVHERVVGVTGVPIENAEYFQVVRYDEGQFYKSHHDQNTPSGSLSGVRLYTFFMYLRSPQEGGQTRFPQLNISITPKRGSALLWANVKNSDLTRSDGRTQHEAVPPSKGIKFGANLWLHNYDFRTPNRNGCDMGKVITSET